MITTQQQYCGYCEEPLNLDETEHFCYQQESYEAFTEYELTQGAPTINYPATELMKAEAFLAQYPEFKEYVPKHYSFLTTENDEFLTPVNYDSDGLPVIQDFTQPEFSREDEWDSIYYNRDNYQRETLKYWRDVEPTRCTSAIYWWTNRSSYRGYPVPYSTPHLAKGFTMSETYSQRYQSLDYSEPALNRYTFDELQGFASEQLIDLNITEKYQYRFFNIFVGRDNNLHVGLLTINSTNGTVSCGHRNCYFNKHPLVIPTDPTREVMETFTHAIIRHGNNHGPDWYVRRPDFAFIHAENCDANHSRSEFCNANAELITVSDLTTLEGAIDFLIHHRKFCIDERCRCTAYYHTLCHYSRKLVAA